MLRLSIDNDRSLWVRNFVRARCCRTRHVKYSVFFLVCVWEFVERGTFLREESLHEALLILADLFDVELGAVIYLRSDPDRLDIDEFFDAEV